MYAYINIGKNATETLYPLAIDQKSVGFFINPLKNNCQFEQQYGELGTWQLTFFKETEFSTKLTVHLLEHVLPPEHHIAQNAHAKAVWFNNEFQTANNERFSLAMSKFLRGSAALSLDKLAPTTQDHYLINDRSGLAYFSGNPDQFKRIILCQTLAVAYSQVMSCCMERLTEALKRKEFDKLLALYEQILFFNASDYFSHPVKLERHELFAVWKLIRDHWHLNELNCELTGQLSSVASFLQEYRDRAEIKAREEERERRREWERDEDRIRQQLAEERREAEKTMATREATRNRKINYAIGFASLLLTFLSIVSLVELTPEHFSQAYQNWLSPIIEKIRDIT